MCVAQQVVTPIHIERADGCTTLDAVSATLLRSLDQPGAEAMAGGGVRVCSVAAIGGLSAVYLVLAAGTGLTTLPTVPTTLAVGSPVRSSGTNYR